ncbi:MAG: NAD(P)H-dependent glycerol-3-phosphate dehydrogenase [Acidimicrobiia bacterium]
MDHKVAVLGGGSWGTALACHLVRGGNPTVLWAREPEVVAGINQEGRNPLFLSDVDLPEGLTATASIERALIGASVAVSSIPTQFIRQTVTPIIDHLAGLQMIVSVSKGIEVGSLLTPLGILNELLPPPLGRVALSGPSFAAEVAAGHPTAVVVAGADPAAVAEAQSLFSDQHLRAYTSDDVVSVELGGALKNVIAIATGIVDGLGYGKNTRAALITRGLVEITRLGVAQGGNPLTFAGLSGLGDLVLTCTGDLSRNRQVGMELGRGKSLDQLLTEMDEVAEGVGTTVAAREMAIKAGISMPIAGEVYRILYEGKDPRLSVLDLMGRDLKDEREGP